VLQSVMITEALCDGRMTSGEEEVQCLLGKEGWQNTSRKCLTGTTEIGGGMKLAPTELWSILFWNLPEGRPTVRWPASWGKMEKRRSGEKNFSTLRAANWGKLCKGGLGGGGVRKMWPLGTLTILAHRKKHRSLRGGGKREESLNGWAENNL